MDVGIQSLLFATWLGWWGTDFSLAVFVVSWLSLSFILVHCVMIPFELNGTKLRLAEKVCLFTTCLTCTGPAAIPGQ